MDAKQTTKSKSSTLPGRFQQRPVSVPYNGGFLGKLKRRFRLKSKGYEFETDTNTNVQCIYFKRGNEELTEDSKDNAVCKSEKKSFELFRSVSERSPSKPTALKNKYEKEPIKKKNSSVVKGNINSSQNSCTNQNRFDLNDPCVNNDFIISSDSGVIDLDHDVQEVPGCHDDVIDDLDLDPGYETLDEIRRKLQIKVPPKIITSSESKDRETETFEIRPTQHRRCQSSGTSEKFLSCMTDLDPRRDSGLGSPIVSDCTGSHRTSSCLTRNSTTSDTDILGCHGNNSLRYSDQNQLSTNLVSLKTNSCPLRQDFEETSAVIETDDHQINHQMVCNSDTCLVQNSLKFQDPVSELYANPKILLQKKSQKANKTDPIKNRLGSTSSGCVEADFSISQDNDGSRLVQEDVAESALKGDIEAEPPPIPERKYSLDNALDNRNMEPILCESEIHVSKSDTRNEFNKIVNDNAEHSEGHTDQTQKTIIQNSTNMCSDTLNVCTNSVSDFNERDKILTTFEFNSEGKVQSFTCVKKTCENETTMPYSEKMNTNQNTSSQCADSEMNRSFDSNSPICRNSNLGKSETERNGLGVPKACNPGYYGGLRFGWEVNNDDDNDESEKSGTTESFGFACNKFGPENFNDSIQLLDRLYDSAMTDSQISYEDDADAILENLNTDLYIDESTLNSSCDVTDGDSSIAPELDQICSTDGHIKSSSFDDYNTKSEHRVSLNDSSNERRSEPFARLPDFYYHDNEPVHMSLSELGVSMPRINSDHCQPNCNDINLEELRRLKPKVHKSKKSKRNSYHSSHSNQSRDTGIGHCPDDESGLSKSDLDERPPAIIPREKFIKDTKCHQDFMESMRQLKDCGWYWGPLSWDEAEIKLTNKPDGSFLVRDSSDDRYILSLSFNMQGRVHHTRIEHHKGKFSFWSQPDSHGKATIKDFIEQCVKNSKNGQFLYFIRPSGPGSPPMPVHLLHPISRFKQMRSLQHMCRFKILQIVRRDHIDRLPIPTRMKNYLNEAQYYVECLGDD